MKKLLLPFMLGSFALPAVAMDYQTDDGFNLPELSADVFDAYNMEANANRTRRPQQRQAPLRTRIFIGAEHTENRFDNQGKTQNTNFLIDGSTSINDRFRVGYVINERNLTYRDGDMDDNLGKRLTATINPRFDTYVSPNFSWFMAFPIRRTIDANRGRLPDGSPGNGGPVEEQAYTIKPGFNYRMGDHTFNITGHFRYVETENYGNNNPRLYNKAYNFNPTYIYRLNRTTNVSLEMGFTENDNPNNTWNRNIKPSVAHRWSNGMRSQFSVNVGKNGQDNGRGVRYTNWQVNNNLPLNRNFDLIANLGWRTGEQYEDDDGYVNEGSGDRETLYFKFGFNVKF
ncbi:hypothetical protein GZ77_25430 [Endozoicomonas montiporae]|uniref:Porin n=2 Tax=Endozoicomonas montiporae TaxID=1027273 RepID=A0A081MZ21_9GAMM|nr:hypothetical protein [Endozoicomonas montiporae]KEQ11444.1 hypothetical protein GZ77_25430 [Endozoicomonas montiporae]